MALPLAVAWRSAEGITLAARIAVRLAEHRRQHLLNTAVIWRRDAWALEAGLLLGKRW